MNQKKEGRTWKNLFLLFVILFFSLFLTSFVLAFTSNFGGASTSGSFSQVNAQYFSPSLGNSYLGNSFSGYMSGPITQGREDETMLDMQLYIPPFSCEPAVVRSDLLEEQNVPVFCKLASMKLNPGIDVTRIERLAITQKEQNNYIAGVGFHPARAAIASLTSAYNNPTSDNLGYVVVVLKRQETEQQMPDNVTVTLSASIQYGANNAYGIGDNEFYLPVLTDQEFENNFREYGFFNGQGYLRVKDIDENSAIISIYSYNNIEVFSDKIEKGKTSRDFYLPNGYWGQRMRITLKEITTPQTKARLSVNGQIYEVYEGAKFFNGKCTLSQAEAISAGTGTARVRCGSRTYDLVRKLNKASVWYEGLSGSFALGEQIVLSDQSRSFYIVYTSKDYAILANASVNYFEGANSGTKISRFMADLSTNVNGKTSIQVQEYISKYNSGSTDAKLIFAPLNDKTGSLNVEFKGLLNDDASLTGTPSDYFENALDSYDYVNDNYPGLQAEQAGYTHYTYGALSLWKQYELANTLGQKEKKQEILSRIVNDYPSSLWKGWNAESLFDIGDVYSEEGSSAFNEKDNIAVSLLSVTDPSKQDVSADIGLSIGSGAENPFIGVTIGDELIKDESKRQAGYSVIIRSITQEGIYVNYSCPTKSTAYDGGRIVSRLSDKISRTTDLNANCEQSLRVSFKRGNLREVAHIVLVPNVYARSRENNFTFSIGIEKRPESMTLTPEEANQKIQELTEQIAELRNLTEDLAEIIRVGKMGCFAVSNVINLKNLFDGMSGGSTARTQVMSYWNKQCESVEFQKQNQVSNVDDCIAKNGNQIENEIAAMRTILEGLNNEVKGSKETTKNGGISDSGALNYRINQDKSSLRGMRIIGPENTPTTSIDNTPISQIIDKLDARSISFSEYTELKKNYLIMNNDAFSQQTRNAASTQIYAILISAKTRETDIAAQDALANAASGGEYKYSIPTNVRTATTAVYQGLTFGASKNMYGWTWDSAELEDKSEPDAGTPIAIVPAVKDGVNYNYLHILSKSGSEYISLNYYKITDKSIVPIDVSSGDPEPPQVRFVQQIAYNNPCRNCNFMKVFTLEPYKGQPALLPFDDVDGWYVQAKQLISSSGAKQSYQDSGRLSSFWICNVGKDGMMDGIGIDQDCARFDLNTGNMLDSFPGLEEKQAKQLVQKAIRAVQSAQEQFARNPSATHINIAGVSQPLRVQGSEGDSGSKCTDFMSVRDCQIIFNFCDPFVCPTSRCDLGGKFPVDNVIQSGIIGSTFLCLPNFIGLPGNQNNGVVLPFCVTGIHAGLNAYADILESYRDCLNESIATNRTVGICDAIQSVYLCELFWNQARPFAEAFLKNVFLNLFGRTEARGGGEYLLVRDSWNNAEKSAGYMSNKYGDDSKLQFGASSITSSALLSDFCEMSVSATYPDNFESMFEPESPVQFHAFFEEATYTTATVPASSRYKVTYIISAGNDSGSYYTVYLKSSPTSLGYTSKPLQVVATGYLQRGGRVSEAKDFIDVSGYQEICVRINTQEECGFKSVSTSFALNYLRDQTVREQATNPVTTENECISGSSFSSAGAFLTPNLGQGISQFVNPDLYNQGVIRVCANRNPGEGTQPSRWSDVGYCDNNQIRCWVDRNSIERAINGLGIENSTLSELEQMNLNNLLNSAEGYLAGAPASSAINDFLTVYGDIAEQITTPEKINYIYKGPKKDSLGSEYKGRTIANLEEDYNALDKRLAVASDRARLAFGKALIYDKIASTLGNKKVAETSSETTPTQTTSASSTSKSDSYTLVLIDGNTLIKKDGVDFLRIDKDNYNVYYVPTPGVYGLSNVLIGTYGSMNFKLTLSSDNSYFNDKSDLKKSISELNGATLYFSANKIELA
ncbi:hypothetical protein FJZ17_03220 [Candidatus Pacearchaeota archaeon]|nr:hypothetical protein [Candidatus Pacearchaeota archaeon]